MTLIPPKPETPTELIIWQNPNEVLDKLKDEDSVSALIALVKLRAADQPYDMTTSNGRKAIISTGERVRKTRIYIEGRVSERAKEMKGEIDKLKSYGDKVTKELNTLIINIRQPVEDFNNAEEKRKEVFTNAISIIKNLSSVPFNATSADIQARLNQLTLPDPMNWQEFADDAESAKRTSFEALQLALSQSLERERVLAEHAAMAEKIASMEGQNSPVPVAQDIKVATSESTTASRPSGESSKFGVSIPVAPLSSAETIACKKEIALMLVQQWFEKNMGMYEQDAKYIFNYVDLNEIPFFNLDESAIERITLEKKNA